MIVSITAGGSNRSSRSMPCGGSKVPTFKVQSKTHAVGNSHVSGISKRQNINSPEVGDDPFRLLASEPRRVKPPDKNSWRAKYKRLSRLETDYRLILDDFEKNLARLN